MKEEKRTREKNYWHRMLLIFTMSLTFLTGTLFGQTPLVKLQLNENTSTTTGNTGSGGGSFTRTTPTPAWSTNVPANVGGASSIDFGTTTGNFVVESGAVIPALQNLSSFTVTLWVNCRNSTVGWGGNRLVSWINNGGDGVDLVYNTNGSVTLSVDQWPDGITGSSANKVTTNASAPASNWVFIAVTYSGTQVQYYFGNNTTNATLDVTRAYNRGAVGASIGRLAVGHFNNATRSIALDRMFRGLIDNVQIFGSVLTQAEIVQIQTGSTPPQPNVYTAKRMLSGLTIDGNPSESVWASEMNTTFTRTIMGSGNNSVTFGAVWDNTNLYVAVRVTDATTVKNGPNLWDDDGVEVYIDAENNGGTSYGPNDRQFNKSYNTSTLAEINGNTTGVLHGWSTVSGGYAIELAIPWSSIGRTAAADLTIGFDVGVNDDDNNEANSARDHQQMWVGTVDNWRWPQGFGDLTLSSTTVGQNVPVTSVSIAPTSVSPINVGGTVDLNETVLPANASNKVVQWQTSNPGVASVSPSGLVTGLTGGTTTITARSTDGTNITSNGVLITVNQSGSSPIIGAYCDNSVANVQQYEQWLGKQTDAILGFTGEANWTDYVSSVNWSTSTDLWGSINRRVLWSIPLLGVETATLDSAVAGHYDNHYRAVAQILANWRPQEPVLYIRTGWEFNGFWMKWTAMNGKQTAFKNAYRRFVQVFRSVHPTRFKFDWCPSIGSQNVPADQCYPGDDVVDVIGMDIYDDIEFTGIPDPITRWNNFKNQPFGLNWHRQFAIDHNKPMAYTEWGAGGKQAGDNPHFVDEMAKWIKSNNVIYANYWNSNAAYQGKLSSGQWPNCGIKYKEHFGPGGGGGASPVFTAEETPDEKLGVYPNPVNTNTLKVQLKADRKEDVGISMLSSTSHKVVETKRTLQKGDNTVEIPVGHLNNGLHVLIINRGRERTVRKVMINR